MQLYIHIRWTCSRNMKHNFWFQDIMCFLRMFGSSLFGRTPIFFTVTSPYFQPPPLEYPLLAQMALLRAGLLVVLFVAAVAAKEGCEAEDEALLQVPCNRKNHRSNLVGLFHFELILCFLQKGRVSHTCMYCNMFYQVLQDVTDLINKIFCQPCSAWNFGAIQKWISSGLSRFSNCPSKISWSFDLVWVHLRENLFGCLCCHASLLLPFLGWRMLWLEVCSPSGKHPGYNPSDELSTIELLYYWECNGSPPQTRAHTQMLST